MLKKILLIALAVFMLISVVGCGANPDTPSTPKQNSNGPSEPANNTANKSNDTSNAKPAESVPGITDDKILIGGTAPFSGANASLGQYFNGMEAYFNYINAEGGINGRQIEFIYYDDAYEPSKTVANVKRLVEDDDVFCVVTHGTSPTAAVADYLSEKNIPNFALAGAASLLEYKNLFTTYIPYATEGQAMGNFVVEKMGVKKVGVFCTNDDFGLGYYAGIESVLKENGAEPVQIIYNVADVDYSSYVIKMKAAAPDVVMVIGAAKIAAMFLQEAETLGLDVPFVGSSGGADNSLIDLVGDIGDGMYFAYYLPLLDADDAKGTAHQAMVNTYLPNQTPNLFTLKGMALAQLIVEGLKGAGDNLTRESLMAAVENVKDWDTGLLNNASYSADNHAPSAQSVYMIMLKDGRFVKAP